jgi:hypothetical protein
VNGDLIDFFTYEYLSFSLAVYAKLSKKHLLQQVYRREGCEIQGAVLWNMSLRPSYGQE